jgi:hypothetical protein
LRLERATHCAIEDDDRAFRAMEASQEGAVHRRLSLR